MLESHDEKFRLEVLEITRDETRPIVSVTEASRSLPVEGDLCTSGPHPA